MMASELGRDRERRCGGKTSSLGREDCTSEKACPARRLQGTKSGASARSTWRGGRRGRNIGVSARSVNERGMEAGVPVGEANPRGTKSGALARRVNERGMEAGASAREANPCGTKSGALPRRVKMYGLTTDTSGTGEEGAWTVNSMCSALTRYTVNFTPQPITVHTQGNCLRCVGLECK
jgi:hypothetical protein